MAKIKVFEKRYKAVVKKTIRFLSVFFYNHLYQPSVFKNLFFKSGIPMKQQNQIIVDTNCYFVAFIIGKLKSALESTADCLAAAGLPVCVLRISRSTSQNTMLLKNLFLTCL